MTEDKDPRLELPGATTPPVEGRRWLWVKAGVWGAALALMIGAAWSVAWVVSNVRVRLDLPPTAEAPPSATPPSDTAPPETPSAAPAPYMNDDGEAITNPVWLRAPQPEYPRAAQRAGEESGMARLACQTRADGGIQGCRIVEERPVGVGFGREAVAATMRARVKPRLVDGQPTESQVVFTIRYRLE